MQSSGVNLRHFKLEDFACKCGRSECDAPPVDMTAALKLDGLRLEFGEPMIVTSGCRCKVQNAIVGGVPNSFHTKGVAFDIKCPDGFYMRRLVLLALKHGFTVGVGKGFVHLDTRPGPSLLFGYS